MKNNLFCFLFILAFSCPPVLSDIVITLSGHEEREMLDCTVTRAIQDESTKKQARKGLITFLKGGCIGLAHGSLNKHGVNQILTFLGFHALENICIESNTATWGHAVGQTIAESSENNSFAWNITWLLALLNA